MSDTFEWALFVVVVISALGIVLVATVLATRHSERERLANEALDAQLRSIIAGTRWVLDSGSIDIVREDDPAELEARWAEVRTKMIDVEARVVALSATSGIHELNVALQYLGHGFSGLRSSLGAHVSAVSHRPPSTQGGVSMLLSTQGIVEERRHLLDSALTPVIDALR